MRFFGFKLLCNRLIERARMRWPFQRVTRILELLGRV